MGALVVRTLVMAAVCLVPLAGCGTDQAGPALPEPTTFSTPPVVPSELASLLAQSDLPAPPSAENAAAFVARLREIDTQIMATGSAQSLVNRGRDQCVDLKQQPESQWTTWANRRFGDGLDDDAARKVIAAARQYICPSY